MCVVKEMDLTRRVQKGKDACAMKEIIQPYTKKKVNNDITYVDN